MGISARKEIMQESLLISRIDPHEIRLIFANLLIYYRFFRQGSFKVTLFHVNWSRNGEQQTCETDFNQIGQKRASFLIFSREFKFMRLGAESCYRAQNQLNVLNTA